MGQGKRIERVRDLVLQIANEILRDVKHPVVRNSFVSFSGVKISPDMGNATVFVNLLSGESPLEEVVEALNSASGFFYSQARKMLHMKKTPSFRFVADKQAHQAQKIMELIEETKTSQPLCDED